MEVETARISACMKIAALRIATVWAAAFLVLLVPVPSPGKPRTPTPSPIPSPSPAQTVALPDSEAVELRVFTATMTQIVLEWDDRNADTGRYELSRDTDSSFPHPVTFIFPRGSSAFTHRVFSDTNRAAMTDRKPVFNGDPAYGPLLDKDVVYRYRVKAVLGGGGEAVSNTVSAQVRPPVRGIEGDLFADLVIGQPDFSTNAMRKTDAHAVQRPGGVLIDGARDKMYVADMNRNRILGFDRSQYPTEHPERPADIVIGQPGMVGCSGGNGDSTFRSYPHRAPASASSLCLIGPGSLSITETVDFIGMAVDGQGNLYVPDLHNNRILEYDDPFANDRAADRVWGQAAFAENEPNRGRRSPSAETLDFGGDLPAVAVALDWAGNLWVTDKHNNRVLRYPKAGGEIAAEADLVLGQPDFASRTLGDGVNLSRLRVPVGIAIDAERQRVYVCDRAAGECSRILMYQGPSFSNGMAASAVVPNPVTSEGRFIYQLRMDTRRHGLWLRYRFSDIVLLDLDSHQAIIHLNPGQYYNDGAIDVDQDGNLFFARKDFWTEDSAVWKYPYPSFTNPEKVFPGQLVASADTMGQSFGAVVFGDQLIVADHGRVLIYNDRHALSSGQAADDVYGQEGFEAFDWNPYCFPSVDAQGRLWMLHGNGGIRTLHAFEYPLQHGSIPIFTLELANGYPPRSFPVLGGGELTFAYWHFMDFAVEPCGDRVWVADEPNNRVVRLSGVGPGGTPYVDAILGQREIGGCKSNMGRITGDRIAELWGVEEGGILAMTAPAGSGAPHEGAQVFEAWPEEEGMYRFRELITPDDVTALKTIALPGKAESAGWAFLCSDSPAAYTLSMPQHVVTDAEGNLYVSDSGGEGSLTNCRILQWDALSIPYNPSQTACAVPADRVLGTGGRFDVTGRGANDPICQPNKVALEPDRNILVCGMNPYGWGQRFPLVYLDPLNDPLPQFALGDYMSRSDSFFDPEGNLYVVDECWDRLLVYWNPFRDFGRYGQGLNAMNDFAVLGEDATTIAIDVLANDRPQGGDLNIVSVSAPGHGTATVNPDRTITYRADPYPAGAAHYADSFEYDLEWEGQNDTARVSIANVITTPTPTGTPAPPTATPPTPAPTVTPTETPIPETAPALDIVVGAAVVSVGEPIAVDAVAQPVSAPFDAWVAVFGPHGLISVTFDGIVPGLQPIAVGVPSLRDGYRDRILTVRHVPPGTEGEYRIVAGFMRAGQAPSIEGAFALDEERVRVR